LAAGSPVWIIVGNDAASGDDDVFALMSLVVGVGGVAWWLELLVVMLFFLFFFELSLGVMQFVPMSHSDKLELFFSFLLSLLSRLYRCAHFRLTFFLI
jgi:hypothetical protein